MRSRAIVLSNAKGDVFLVQAIDVKFVGVYEASLIAICGTQVAQHIGSRCECHSRDLCLCLRLTDYGRNRSFPAQGFSEQSRYQAPVTPHTIEQVGILQETEKYTAQQMIRGPRTKPIVICNSAFTNVPLSLSVSRTSS